MRKYGNSLGVIKSNANVTFLCIHLEFPGWDSSARLILLYTFCKALSIGPSFYTISLSTLAVDGQWQEWSSWSQCSVTCSNGTQQRSRQCTAAAHGGSECRGPWAESRECYNPECTGEA